jgi:hypothetical protein
MTRYELCMALVEQHYEAAELLREMRWVKQIAPLDDKEEAARYQNEINALANEVDKIGRIASIERYMLLAEANKVDLADIVVSAQTAVAQLALQTKLDAMYNRTEEDAL